ncbi:MAG: hypothetical protein SWY16_02025 [Cyanobacteriota bacterium]|nr:hypothetical protein [Cyanobacteriota bacterium]
MKASWQSIEKKYTCLPLCAGGFERQCGISRPNPIESIERALKQALWYKYKDGVWRSLYQCEPLDRQQTLFSLFAFTHPYT